MQVIGWFIQGLFSLASAVTTDLSLWANYKGWSMWGLAWEIWAMLGFAVFVLATFSVVIHLVWLYVLPEARLKRRKLGLEVEDLEAEKRERERRLV